MRVLKASAISANGPFRRFRKASPMCCKAGNNHSLKTDRIMLIASDITDAINPNTYVNASAIKLVIGETAAPSPVNASIILSLLSMIGCVNKFRISSDILPNNSNRFNAVFENTSIISAPICLKSSSRNTAINSLSALKVLPKIVASSEPISKQLISFLFINSRFLFRYLLIEPTNTSAIVAPTEAKLPAIFPKL